MNLSNLNGNYTLLKHGTFDIHGNYSSTSSFLKGEINYASDGSLSVLILFHESVENAKSILSYVGKYEIQSKNSLIHHITLCSQQKRNNTSEIREFVIDGKTLTLSCPLDNGSRFEAVWVKQQ